MTTNQPTSPPSRNRWMAIALIIGFAIATFVLTRPQTGTSQFSPVSGLMTLKTSAQSAMPYDAAIANGKPTLIEFYADWCTVCQGMAPTLSAIHEEFDPALNFVMLNIDDPQWRSPIQQFQVSGVPHFILLDANHEVTDAFVGNVPKSALHNQVVKLLGEFGLPL